jgi:hypothetical protein
MCPLNASFFSYVFDVNTHGKLLLGLQSSGLHKRNLGGETNAPPPPPYFFNLGVVFLVTELNTVNLGYNGSQGVS